MVVVVNWKMPGDVFEGEPNAVQLDNGNDKFVAERTVKLVVCVLVKLNWRTPLPGRVAPAIKLLWPALI